MKNRITLNLISIFLVAIIVVSGFFILSPLKTLASSSTSSIPVDTDSVIRPSINVRFTDPINNDAPVGKLRPRQEPYNLEFNLNTSKPDIIKAASSDAGSPVKSFSVESIDSWELIPDAKMELSTASASTEKSATITVVVKGIICRKQERKISFKNITVDGVTPFTIDNITIPEDYFRTTSSTSSESSTPETPPTSNTILENYVISDSKGNRITELNKDTPPFTLTVTYLEYGLEGIDLDDMSSGDYSVFFSNMGGLLSDTGTRGKLDRLTSSANGIPRFRATFSGLTYDEKLGNAVEIKMIYDIEDHYTDGKLALVISQAKTKDDKDDKEIAPLKPYIIIDKFDFGEEQIVAGSEFTLNVNYTNTSASIGLENIVMTVVPPEASLAIASSSNTQYVAAMPPKGTLSHTIDLRALSNAKVGSAEVTITFTYQYVDSVNKVREEVKDLTQKISIPITQLDRFALDPIRDVPTSALVGENFEIPISYINRGKSTTFNITATAKSKTEIQVTNEHGKNLEAGQSDSLEIGVVCNTPGELIGEIEVQYEDETGKTKTLKEPFSIMIEEPVISNPEDDKPLDPNANKPVAGLSTIVSSIVGSLFIAIPIGYYFVKRSLRKDSEGFDEDF